MQPDYTPSQVRIYRAVHGAVRNTADGHPTWKLTRVMARSIAKRATGTLTAQWAAVLAAKPSERCGVPPIRAHSSHASLATEERGGGRRCGSGAVTAPARRSPLRLLHNRLGAMAGEARRAGQTDRHQALVEALRLIAEQQNRVGSP